MSNYGYEPRRREFLFGTGLSSGVRLLLAWNLILFLVQQLVDWRMEYYFGLVPALVWNGWVWQLVTYMFLHGSFMHILFNMIALWLFGSEIENLWGTKKFLQYYFFTGIGAGLTTLLVTPNSVIPTIGASGAVYGILLAYGVTYPNRQILLYFLFPIKAKYFVILFGLIELIASISGTRSGIAHAAHLGGLVFGYFYIKGFPGQKSLRRWRRERQRRRFRVVDFRDQDDADRR